MDKNSTQVQLPYQPMTIQTQTQTQAPLQNLENLQTDAVQTAVLQTQTSETAMITELTRLEQQTGRTAGATAAVPVAAAPAPAIQQQRRKKTLKEKLADWKQQKAEARRQREAQEEQARAEREAQAAREAEERRRQEEEENRAEAWRQEQERLMDEMDDMIRDQGKVKEAKVREQLRESTEAVMKDLTDEERNALWLYTTEGRHTGGISYRSMNQILRNGAYQAGGGEDGEDLPLERQKENFEQVTHVIEALQRSKLPKDLAVRRGADFSTLVHLLNLTSEVGEDGNEMAVLYRHFQQFNNGSFLVCDRGFLSASPYQNGGFFAGGANGGIGVEFIIKAHKDDEALLIENLSDSSNEAEMLFQAGTQYRIIKICPPTERNRKLEKGSFGSYKVYMETIPNQEPLRGK